MRHCPSCQIDYNGELDRCALCGTTLTGTPSPSPFPHIPLKKVSKRARRILAASTLALLIAWIVACIALNLPWTVCVAASVALVLNYLFIRNIMTHSPNTLRAIKRYFLVVMAMALLWFFATGSSVVSSYVIPIISLAAIFSDAALLIIMGKRMIVEYGKYLLYDIIFGAVPPLLVLSNTVMAPELSWSCALVAAAMLASLLILARRSVTDEAKKLFNA